MRRAAAIALGAVLCAGPAAFAADPPLPIGAESRQGFGRLAFNFPIPVRFRVERSGDKLSVIFTTNRPLGDATPPRNVLSVAGGEGRAEITVAPGAQIRPGRTGNRIVIDVLDPPPGAPAPGTPSSPDAARTSEPPPHPQAATAETARAESAHLTPEPAHAAEPAQGSEPPAALAGTGPVALSAQLAPTPAGWSLTVPFEADVGAASFRSGDTAIVVFDARRPIDLAPVRTTASMASASVQLLPAATVLRLPLDPNAALALTRTADGWTVRPALAEPRAASIRVQDRTLAFGARQPGRVVTMVDQRTGLTLLVGTQRGPGQGVLVPRRAPEFELVPTWQGVVVSPLSDTVVLKPRADGFVLTAEPDGLSVSLPDGPDALAPAGTLTRRFDLAPVADEALAGRLRAQVAEASSVPPLARGRKRRDAAQTMIALGMGAEASALLKLAATEDAREAESADAGGLLALASLLAGRPQDASALADPRLDGTDEIALWRAVRTAALAADGAADAGAGPPAPVLAATARLVLAYPAKLRDRILPLTAETLASGGEPEAAASLIADRPDDPDLALARAMLAEARHDTDAALAQYDALASGRDRLTRVRAALRAIDLRIASGKLPREDAIAALERLLVAWRGDQRALAIRTRLAELQAEAGATRQALATLREAAAEQPGAAAALRARMSEVFSGLARDGAASRIPPLDLAALAEENRDLMPGGEEGLALATTVADRLMALDLPGRVGPLLDGLMRAAPAGPARAEIGVRLAALRLDDGDVAGAAAALTASDAAELPPALADARTLTGARIAVAQAHGQEALAMLAPLATPQADEVRATIEEAAKNWQGAERALASYAGKTVPQDGRLDETQRRTLLRWATAAVQAGDAETLAALRQREGGRMEGGALGDMFRLLTVDPVRRTADLARSRQDVAAARALPEQLRTLSDVR